MAKGKMKWFNESRGGMDLLSQKAVVMMSSYITP